MEKVKDVFNKLTSIQKVLVAVVVVVVIFLAGRSVLGSGLDGTYTGTMEEATVTLSINGKTGNFTATDGSKTMIASIENIDMASKKMTIKEPKSGKSAEWTFENEGNILEISSPNIDDTLKLVKQ